MSAVHGAAGDSAAPARLGQRREKDSVDQRALWAVVMEAYVHGVSTRELDDLVQAPGIAAGHPVPATQREP